MKRNKVETKKTILIVLISLGVVGLVVVGLLFLLNGKTTTTGEKTSASESVTLVCSGENVNYQKLPKTDAERETLKLTVMFDGDRLESIGLSDTFFFANSSVVNGKETTLNAALWTGLTDIGLDISALSNKFSQIENRLILSLFAEKSELNEKTLPYFLVNAGGDVPNSWTVNDFERNYVGLGLSCERLTSSKNQ